VRSEARLYRCYLEVQRESVGLRDHGALDELYTALGDGLDALSPVPDDPG